jgi:phosphonate transport system permease protein
VQGHAPGQEQQRIDPSGPVGLAKEAPQKVQQGAAGVLALFMADLGIFGKLFSEAIEAADDKPVEGVLSTGGTSLASVRFGVLPQLMPVMLSQMLYQFESNTRSASIIGIVGAGGIGLILSEQIRTLELQQMSFVILMILVTVSVIDFFCSKIRFAIIGKRAH